MTGRDPPNLMEWTPSFQRLHDGLRLALRPHLLQLDALSAAASAAALTFEQAVDQLDHQLPPRAALCSDRQSESMAQDRSPGAGSGSASSVLSGLPAALQLELRVRWLFLR